MLTPGFGASLGLALLSLACWGSWSNTAKASGKLPFPIFYLDFSASAFAAAALVFVTAGSGTFFHGGDTEGWPKRVAAAAAAGVVFNFANVLLVAAISIAGLVVAFPVGIGTALVLGTLLNFLQDESQADPLLLFGGVAAAFGAICFQVAANVQHKRDLAAAPNEPLASAPEDAASQEPESLLAEGSGGGAPASGQRGLLMCVVCGVLMASWSPLSTYSMDKKSSGERAAAPSLSRRTPTT